MDIPGMQDEMRRPMMLIISANKKVDVQHYANAKTSIVQEIMKSYKMSVIERVWGYPHQDKSHRMTGCQTAILLNMGGSCSYLYPSI